jgi:hypothetical protein
MESQTAVGTLFVVFLLAMRREPAGLGQVLELLDVQQLVAKSAENDSAKPFCQGEPGSI